MPEPKSLEDLLAPTGSVESIEDLLAEKELEEKNVALGLTPGGLTSQEQEAGREFYTGTVPRFATTAVGGYLGNLPGAMAGAAAGELLTGRGKERALESAVITGAAGKAGNLAVRGLGYLGGVLQKAITPVLKSGPIRTIKAIKKPPGAAEEKAALSALKATRRFTSMEGGKFPEMQRAEAALQELDKKLASMRAHPSKKIVTGELDRMIAARTPAANPEELAANAKLERFKKFVPEFKNATELHDWLRRIRGPIREQLGKEGAPLHADDLKDLQAFVRKYRDRLLGGEKAAGPQAFAKASRQIEAARNLQDIIVDSEGNMRPGAEGAWRRVLNDKNHTVRRAMETFDELTGENITRQADTLAMRRLWNPEDAGNAVFILSIIARALRLVARTGAKTAAVIRPLVPPTAATLYGETAPTKERRIGPAPAETP